MSNHERFFQEMRDSLQPFIKPVDALSRAAGEKLGDRPFEEIDPKNHPFGFKGEQQREVFIEAPSGDVWYRILEKPMGNMGTSRWIEILTNPDNTDLTTWRGEVLPGEVIADSLEINNWSWAKPEEVMKMAHDVKTGHELSQEKRDQYKDVKKRMLGLK